jgi:hypothetical protein
MAWVYKTFNMGFGVRYGLFRNECYEREMKMVKKTLIALAVVAILTTSAHAALSEWYLDGGDSSAVKVDGKDQPTFRWPYTISFKALKICTIPIKMDVGMYVQVIDCDKKKIVLTQVDCGDIGQGSDKYPCYLGCVEFDVRANFEVKLGSSLNKTSDIIKDWASYYEGGDVVPGDGNNKKVKLCVKAWSAQLYKHAAGDQVDVGSVDVTVKPNS